MRTAKKKDRQSKRPSFKQSEKKKGWSCTLDTFKAA